MARFLPAMAAQQPDVLALRVPRGRTRDGAIRYLDLTFAQLETETNAWASRLASAGITRGTRVLLLVTPGLSLIALCFALFKTGAVPVVIDPGMGLRTFLRCVARTRPEAMVAIARGIWVARLFRQAFTSVRARLEVRPHQPLTLGADASGAGVSPRFDLAPTHADDLAAILFTSGTTGAPKGVCYEHGMFEAQIHAVRDTYGIEPGEVDLPMLPVFALFNPALGVTTVVPEMNPSCPAAVDPAKIVQAIRQCGVTTSFGAPVLWRKIGDHCLRHGITLPGMRRILMAGAPAPPALMADLQRILPNGRVHSPYGATEALPVTTISDREVLEFSAELTRKGHGTCVGRPLREVDVRVIRQTNDPIARWTDAREVPAGEIGEIVVRGPVVTKAYDQLPDATAMAKIPPAQPALGAPKAPESEISNLRSEIPASPASRLWHRMGDTGYFDADGRLWFCGRKAERVAAAKGTLYTERCEPVFNQHPRVARTALIQIGPPGGEEPAVVVEPRAGCWPHTALARLHFAEELRELGLVCETTRDIVLFFFHRKFPVDVRHNAKIHRLALARHFATRRPIRTT
ncbi:MAG: fatty acid CoA ligase family protein [Opitutaceae bacterium]